MRERLSFFVCNGVLLTVLVLAVPGLASAADAQSYGTNPVSQSRSLEQSPYFFTTKAYEREAARVFLAEINRVARELNLSEPSSITESNLTEVLIATPGSGMIGSISTTNYTYYARADKKFAGVDQRSNIWERQSRSNLWPISRMNTNAAFATATQIMAAAGMDSEGLNRDCRIDIRASMPDGPRAKYFVPDYWVTWKKPGKVVAFLVFSEPAKTIRTLSMWDSAYVLRKPIVVPNAGELLRQGNPPAGLLEKLGLVPTNTLPKTNESTGRK